MNLSFLVTILIVLMSIYIWIGQRAANSVTDEQSYFLMNRKLTFFPLCMTLLATMMGGGVLVGASQAAYTYGFAVIIYPLGTCMGFVVLGLGFGARLRRLDIETMPEIFEKIYQSNQLRKIAAVISMLSLYAILVGQAIAVKSFLTTIGLGNPLVFFICWASFIAYTTMGGFKAVVDTDVVQALFIMGGLIIATLSIDINKIYDVIPGITSMSVTQVPWSSWFLMPLCFILIGQDMGQRCFATKNPAMIAPAAIIAGILLLIGSGVAILFGLMAQKSGLDMIDGSNILMQSVIALTSPNISALFAAVIIMAIASTADSLLCSITSNLCTDFTFLEKLSNQKQIMLTRVLTFSIGLSSLVFACMFNNVVDALMFSYELSISVLFIPIFMTIVFKTSSKMAAKASMLTGALAFILFKFHEPVIPREILTLLLSLASYTLIMMISKIRIGEVQYD